MMVAMPMPWRPVSKSDGETETKCSHERPDPIKYRGIQKLNNNKMNLYLAKKSDCIYVAKNKNLEYFTQNYFHLPAKSSFLH